MIIVASKDGCSYCKHIRENKDGWIPCCDAFPEGIPDEYVFEQVDVTKLKECSNGIKYVPDIEAQKRSGYLK